MATAQPNFRVLGVGRNRSGSISAIESAIDAHASRVLRKHSPEEASIDPSLGPYVTSILRSSSSGVVPEELLELLQEQCVMDEATAREASSIILYSVRTGVVHDCYESLTPNPASVEHSLIPADLWGVLDGRTSPELISCKNTSTQQQALATPPSTSIHVVQKYPSSFRVTQTDCNVTQEEEKKTNSPLRRNSIENQQSLQSLSRPISKRHKETLAKDLAETLFVPSSTQRSRSNSVLSEVSMSASVTSQLSQPQVQQQYPQYDYLPTVEMLLSLNHDLSEEAAWEAASVSNNDVNVAQFLLEKAVSAPPVCRHLLAGNCYRSDCQFSHDLEGYTCSFWMRGRCGKGEACRFLHGFSENLLEGIAIVPLTQNGASMNSANSSNAYTSIETSKQTSIATTNLVQHNASSVQQQQNCFLPYKSKDKKNSTANVFGSSLCIPKTGGVVAQSPLSLRTSKKNDTNSTFYRKNSNIHSDEQSFGPSPGMTTSSFASVASKGYHKKSFTSPMNTTSNTSTDNVKYAKIPQDLWNPHYNRSSTAFHIVDPMERYHEVMKSHCTRKYGYGFAVIDLHFQSIKTFPLVLSSELPDKLRASAKGEVWVVTGSGHHVNRHSHQKGGGVLENAVTRWLTSMGYEILRGRDKNGFGGAVLVKGRPPPSPHTKGNQINEKS